MKKGNLILLALITSLLLISCKNDKASKSVDKAKDVIENVAEAVEGKVDEINSDLEQSAVGTDTSTEVEGIGSEELEELKKAQAEEARKPKMTEEKGKRPNSVPKPTANKNSGSNPRPTKPGKIPKPTSPTSTKVPTKPSASTESTSGSTSGSSTSGSTRPNKNTSTASSSSSETKIIKEIPIEETEAPVDAASTTSSNGRETKVVKNKPAGSATSNEEPAKVGVITKPGSSGTSTKIETKTSGVDHAPFNTLLGKFVSSNGDVNYAQLKASSRSLNSYCNSLSANPPQDSWSKTERLAYWLNAYNAFTLKLITDNYPVASITDLDGGKPWDKKWIKIGNETLSLNGIENDIIRPRFNDARIHFAVNCAAKSCPPLANYAFTASNVNSKLNALTKSFVNSSSNSLSSDAASISKIFDWYKADFGNVIDFLNKYANTKVNSNARVTYMEYDWSLNGK